MSGIWVLLLLIFISSIPVIIAFCWLRIVRYPLSLVRFLILLLTGAAAFFPALVLQNFFSGLYLSAGRWALFVRIFIHIALTEELSRLLVLLILFWLIRRAAAKTFTGPSAALPALSYNEASQGAAAGLIAGLGFAVLESAAYGASNAGVALLRTFTAAPLHGACGSRVGTAAVMFPIHPAQALFRFFTAVAIHSIYNFMIAMPGFPAIAALLIALSALASSVLSIRSGRGAASSMTTGL
jgi:RsiW-degrading membrane proteinase PrsW (M82 family)